MNFLCPACRTPLPAALPAVVACTQCGVEVDLTRVDTAPGQARLWPEVDLSGETLGNFKLLSRAGSGGMGTVYLAEGLAGRCAVKVLSAQMAADPGLRERFRREAQALRAVQHKGIVRIIDEGAENGFCWYAMEHVEGPDLRARLASSGPLPAAEVESIARDLLDALAAVHDAQLVHRDLKPANILLSSTGARLCDFGIARFDGATTLTESAALLGSLRYMAPEQRAGQTSPKSDLYALGLVLHEALTKSLPGETELPASTPRRLRKLIEQLLQSAPRLRPADARAAAAMIAVKQQSGLPRSVLVGAPLLVVAAFGAWAVLALQATPPVMVPLPPPQLPPSAVIATAEAANDAGAVPVADVEATPQVPPPTPYSLTTLDDATVTGGLQTATVTEVLQAHLRDLSVCYEDERSRLPGLTGALAARFVVRAAPAQGRTPPVLRVVLAGGPPAPQTKVLGTGTVGTSPGIGRVTSVELLKTSLQDKLVIACVLEKIRTWRFPQPVGEPATIEATWHFAPTGGATPPIAVGPKPSRGTAKPAAGKKKK